MTIYPPVIASTNDGYTLRVDMNVGTNTLTIGSTNAIYFTTNRLVGVGAASVSVWTNGVTTLIFDKQASEQFPRIFGW
jgi:hypothetical protein